MILFRQKYPRWWFDWNLELQRFSDRVGAYLALMDDRYPSTDEHQSVHLDYRLSGRRARPEPVAAAREVAAGDPALHRAGLPGFAAFFVVVIAWFAILFTGRYPRGLFDFVVGVMRWNNRVVAYTVTFVTDAYPPFRLSA